MMVFEKKTELWVSVAAIVIGVALAALGQIFPDTAPEWVRITSIIGGSILTALSALGYTIARTAKKIAEGKALAEVEKAEIENALSPDGESALVEMLGNLLGPSEDDGPELVDPPEEPLPEEEPDA